VYIAEVEKCNVRLSATEHTEHTEECNDCRQIRTSGRLGFDVGQSFQIDI
jgi:hypothetical protein